ncbi:MAG TPA: (d)CMP kinase [Longimicrobiales bacterium]|nr:(d)CMP kinase [Longimicrobiales bacterium]
MIIAIDGPAGSGKSSTAREVARRLGFLHVDSGAFYRALTYGLLGSGVPESAWEGLEERDLDRLRVRGEAGDGRLTMRVGGEVVEDGLRTPDINARVSHVARIPAVRAWLLDRLRELADADVVVDGRDIGTAVFPRAELKVFLEADPEVRARRRLAEQGVADPDDATLLAEVRRLRARDRLDSEREVAPLRRADDAVRVDTTALTFEEQIAAILELVRARR